MTAVDAVHGGEAGRSASGYDAAAVERWVAEPPKGAGRTAFERDRARIMHSSALRRLAAKTQVHGPSADDFVRNRLTHSLEVAQIGREFGRAIGCDPDVVDTACLAHDLGHPPFGHNGERALAEFADTCGGFEGNAQTLRILTRLEAKAVGPGDRSVGLNLTRASLDAATKYPWSRADAPRPSGRYADGSLALEKFGVYEEDRSAFDWLRAAAPAGRRCLEAQVMDFADDVAYSVHDLEDGVQASGIDLRVVGSAVERADLLQLAADAYAPGVPVEELGAALDRLQALPYWVTSYDGDRRSLAALKNMTSQLIGRFCATVERQTLAAHERRPLTRYAADLLVPPEVSTEFAVLKGVAARYVMFTDARAAVMAAQRALLRELTELIAAKAPDTLDPEFRADWQAADDDRARRRVVVDQVASLTDPSAVARHRRLSSRDDRR